MDENTAGDGARLYRGYAVMDGMMEALGVSLIDLRGRVDFQQNTLVRRKPDQGTTHATPSKFPLSIRPAQPSPVLQRVSLPKFDESRQ
jgi:hypothetical protein